MLAGLSRFPGARGRIQIGGRDYSIGEMVQGLDVLRRPSRLRAPVRVARRSDRLIGDFAEVRPRDRVLLLYPVWQFRKDATE